MTDRSAIEKLASGQRSVPVTPPPKPVAAKTAPSPLPDDEGGEVIDLAAAETKPASATRKKPQRTAAKQKKSDTANEEAGIGRPRGNRREIQARISNECADALYSRAETQRLSLGAAAMEFVRGQHREMRAESTWTKPADDGFAPIEAPAPRSLPSGMSKRLVSIRITPAEADALKAMKEEVRMSIPYILDEAIRRTPLDAGGLGERNDR